MPEAVLLGTYQGQLGVQERERILEGGGEPNPSESLIYRDDGSGIDLNTLDNLMTEFDDRRQRGDWSADRAVSDRWLAPRLHWALRLTRAEASERGTWLWLALRYAPYVEWRWSGKVGITEDRWYGPIHKQALARLWWGGELFRNGEDYTPVERAFVRQDLPNSYLHRPLVRCRSLALGILDVTAPEGREEEISAAQVNDLARVLNLATAGSPPEVETDYRQDDIAAYASWVLEVAEVPHSWERIPEGPACVDTTETSLAGGRRIANRGRYYTERSPSARR
jgi:Family of unknown function (DUF6339)